MSLIQEALEKAGRIPSRPQAATSPSPSPASIYEGSLELPKMTAECVSEEKDPVVRIVIPRHFEISKKIVLIAGALLFLAGFGIFQMMSQKVRPTVASLPSSLVQTPASSAKSFVQPPLAVITGTLSKPNFKLNGITSSNGQYTALINGQLVGVGDRLQENAVIKTIQEHAVILDFRGKEIELQL